MDISFRPGELEKSIWDLRDAWRKEQEGDSVEIGYDRLASTFFALPNEELKQAFKRGVDGGELIGPVHIEDLPPRIINQLSQRPH